MKNHVDSYVEVFTDMSIPVQCDNSSNLFENNEIKLILSLLRTIDNPTKDISLLSTMMSPVLQCLFLILSDIWLRIRG